MLSQSDKALLLHSFPISLTADVLAVLPFLPEPVISNCFIEGSAEVFLLEGERVAIPARSYFREPEAMPLTTGNQPGILHCIYLRNHNGYVRQRALAALDRKLAYWMVPFVTGLIGEYVVEIMEDLDSFLTGQNMPLFVRFVQENPLFWQKTECRIVSYWDAYYRHRYPDIRKYPGRMLANRINAAL